MGEKSFTDLERRDEERHLLVAVDESMNSRRAVMYLADFFGAYRDVFITMLSIIPEPSEDYFATEAEREQWLMEHKQEIEAKLAEYREILLEAGFRPEQLESRLVVQDCNSIADAILKEQDKLRCCIVVVGRRGLTHNEEFVFGSTSSKILHNARNCAVLVVE